MSFAFKILLINGTIEIIESMIIIVKCPPVYFEKGKFQKSLLFAGFFYTKLILKIALISKLTSWSHS